MSQLSLASITWRSFAGLAALLAAGCGSLQPAAAPQVSFHSLDGMPAYDRAAARPVPTTPGLLPTLIVNPPHAAPGFDSRRIIYVRAPHTLEYFARSEWVDTPARMLAPLIVSAIGSNGAFRAVVSMPSAAAGDLRLDTEIIRLQQDFSSQPSQVRLTLRAYLVDTLTRRVLAWREFDETATATSDDPDGGVLAANRAVQAIVDRLAQFSAETARDRPLPANQ